MSYYYWKMDKDNYEDDIKNLNNKIDIIYTSLQDIIQDRNDLLLLFNSRINHNVSNENIFNDDIYVDGDDRYKLIFTGISLSGNIYKYVFHIFIKSDFNEVNSKFIINNKYFTYDIFVNKFKYLKIEQKFIFNKVENFKIYLKSNKPLVIMKYSSYELLIKCHGATVLNNQDNIKELYCLNKKLDENLNEKLDQNNKLIREFVLKDIQKDDLPI